MTKTLILGGGLSGLALAYNLEEKKDKDYLILEAAKKAGGLCASYTKDGFIFDYSGHLLHIANKQTLKLLQKLLGKNVLHHKRRAYVYFHGVKLPFPFQNNLYGLDDKFISECVKAALIAYKEKDIKDTQLFKNWALAQYGQAICKHFLFPYNQKLWQFDLNKMTSDWCGAFIPKTALEDIIKGAYTRRKKDFGYNANFFYPKTGGAGALADALLSKISNIKYSSKATSLDIENKTVHAGGKSYKYNKLVSTMPLTELGKITKKLPPQILKDFKALKHNSLYVLNLAVSGETKDGHWYYFAEDKYPFFRVGVQSSFSPNNAPKNTSSFYIEFAFTPAQKPNTKELEKQTIALLRELGFIEQDSKVLVAHWLKIPVAYPIYDTKYAQAQKNIIDYMKAKGIYLLGRYGAWEYSFMEKSLLDAKALAESLENL
ncbi:MAG: FAD-dependent oxidoreductase [Elusimicrobiota bacterium]|jgi:protoporphyrinogen oxidase|nr:FAD-dependent oxidoreductase [Elusimicrobiota bacterium]